MNQRLLKVRNDLSFCAGVVAVLGLVDNIIGGTIYSAIQGSAEYIDPGAAQVICDMYAVMFWLFALVTLILLYGLFGDLYRLLATVAMLMAYSENLAYYAWFYITTPLIGRLSGFEAESLMPERVFGWVGYVSRRIGFVFEGFPVKLVIAESLVVILLMGAMFWQRTNLIKK